MTLQPFQLFPFMNLHAVEHEPALVNQILCPKVFLLILRVYGEAIVASVFDAMIPALVSHDYAPGYDSVHRPDSRSFRKQNICITS